MNVDALPDTDLNVDAVADPELSGEDDSEAGEGETTCEEFSSEDLGSAKPTKRKAAQLEDPGDFKSPSTQLKKSDSLGKTTKSPKSPQGKLICAPVTLLVAVVVFSFVQVLYSFFTLNFR